jgi:hypothetical protein
MGLIILAIVGVFLLGAWGVVVLLRDDMRERGEYLRYLNSLPPEDRALRVGRSSYEIIP